MAEFQQDFLGRDKKDRDYHLVQFKSPMERIRDFDLWWRSKGFSSRSGAINMVIAKILDNERTIHDPATIRPIETAINDIRELIPVLTRHGLLKSWDR